MESVRRDGKQIQIKMSDLLVLMYHLQMGASLPAVGFEDADNTINFIMKELQRSASFNIHLIESALWSCNLMDELGYFWHPENRSFNSFLKRMLINKNYKFDKMYNLLLESDTKGVAGEV